MVPFSRMGKRKGLMAVLTLIAVVGLAMAEEAELTCYDGPFESVLLDGCADDCRSFETLSEAEAHCNALGAACGGITKSAYGDDEAISLGVGLYEVRAGPGIEAAKGDTAWIKQVDCAPDGGGETAEQQAAVGDLESLIKDRALTPLDGGTADDYCFSYSAPVQGQYLEGCVDECKSFETLDEAEAHCNSLDECGGVTHSLYGEGQSWHEGNGPFEVRQGPTLKPSQDGDVSWVRIEHRCDDQSGGQDYLDPMSLETSVETADHSLMTALLYLVGLLVVASLLVYVAYTKGHQPTTDLVDEARDKVRSLLGRQRRGAPLASQGAYQSL